MGMFSVIPVTLFHAIFPELDKFQLHNSVLNVLFRDYFRAGFIEELIKSLFFFGFIIRLKYEDFAEVMDGIVYFGILGAGFAVYEDFWYIFQNSYPPWEAGDLIRFNQVFHQMILSRAFPGHILFDCIAGYFFSLSKFNYEKRSKLKLIFTGLIVAAFTHGTFNLIARISDATSLLIYILFLILIIVVLRTQALKNSPFRKLLQTEKNNRLEDKIRPQNFYYPIERYILDENAPWQDKPRRNPWRFIPMLIILIPLYPLVFLLIFYLNKSILSIF
jgi:RsiW-degrading membrane proteinase PrsW (M82 family)